MAAVQAATPAGGHRRRRLRRQSRRRGDYRARAVRRFGVRAANAASPAGHARGTEAFGSSRKSTSVFRRSRSSIICPSHARTARRPSCRSWRAAASTALSASSRIRAERKSAGRSSRCWTRSEPLADHGVREVTLLGQNVNAYCRSDGGRHRRGFLDADSLRGRQSRASSASASPPRIRWISTTV